MRFHVIPNKDKPMLHRGPLLDLPVLLQRRGQLVMVLPIPLLPIRIRPACRLIQQLAIPAGYPLQTVLTANGGIPTQNKLGGPTLPAAANALDLLADRRLLPHRLHHRYTRQEVRVAGRSAAALYRVG